MLELLSIGVPFLFIYIDRRHGFGNEFYLWYEHDVLLHDGFPVLEKRKGNALSDDYVAHDCGRPLVATTWHVQQLSPFSTYSRRRTWYRMRMRLVNISSPS